jgi:hypothetical protein
MSAEESLERAEALLAQLDAARAELEALDEDDDPDKAIDILARLSEIAKEVEAELARAKREAEVESDVDP